MISRFLRDSVLYGAANLVARGLGLVLLPLYTRTLSPQEIGAYELLAAVSMSLVAVLPLEITQAVARLRTQQMADDELRACVTTAFSFSVLVFSAFALVAFLGSHWLSGWLPDSVFAPLVIALAAALLFLNGLFGFFQNELRWTLQTRHYALISLLTAAATAGAAAVFLAVFDWGLPGLYGALIIGVASGLLVAASYLPNVWRFRIDRRRLREMLAFSTPLAFSSLFLILAATIDRLLVARLLDLEALGQYGVAMRVAAIAMLAFQGFQLAVLPATVGQAADGNRESNLEQSFRVFLVVAFAVALGLGTSAPEVLAVLATDAYSGVALLVPILLIGTVFSAAYPFAPGLWLRGHTRRMALVGMCIALVGFVASLSLIPLAGLIGAASAYAITGVAYCVVMFWASDRVYPVGRRYGRLALACGMFIGGTIGMAWLLARQTHLGWRLGLSACVLVGCTLALTSAAERKSALIGMRARCLKR